MKKPTEGIGQGNKKPLLLPKKIEYAITKSKAKFHVGEKERQTDEIFEKYMSPIFPKKNHIGPSDRLVMHKKLRSILSRKPNLKAVSPQVSQVTLKEDHRN